MFRTLLNALALAALSGAAPAAAATLCTMVADAADGRVLLEQGACRARVTPASTFKVPLAVIGFDSGILKDAHSPVLPFRAGYVDWGGQDWRQPIDPTQWLKYSVVWYSQVIAHRLGEQRLSTDTARLGFGNADFSGDPGRHNGLDRAWIGSSLKVSPAEQVVFLRKLVTGQLPVSAEVMTQAQALVEIRSAEDGWQVHGKTGTAYPRRPDGALDKAHAWGWYVGWATREGRTLVFARLTQDEREERTSGGIRTRDGLLRDWPALAAAHPP